MSKYTTELRWIIEQEESQYSGEKEYHASTYKKIGLDSYPIFDESYRDGLNNKIIDHFYFREIGFETVALFARFMRRTMNEIMPYYNKLYESELIKIDPTRDVDMWYDTNQTRDNDETWNKDNTDDYTQDHTENWTKDNKEDYTKDNVDYNITTNDTTQHTDTRDHNRNVFSDTPMNMLNGDDNGQLIENLNYATTVTYDDGTGTSDGRSNSKTQSDDTRNEEKHLTADEKGNKTYKDTQDRDMTERGSRAVDETLHNVKHEAGFRESQAKLLMLYRETFLNIDMMIIDDLEDLFMGVW